MKVKIDLAENEMLAINNALNEIINGNHAIDEWEFSTLIGVEKSEAAVLLVKICTALDSLGNDAS